MFLGHRMMKSGEDPEQKSIRLFPLAPVGTGSGSGIFVCLCAGRRSSLGSREICSTSGWLHCSPETHDFCPRRTQILPKLAQLCLWKALACSEHRLIPYNAPASPPGLYFPPCEYRACDSSYVLMGRSHYALAMAMSLKQAKPKTT